MPSELVLTSKVDTPFLFTKTKLYNSKLFVFSLTSIPMYILLSSLYKPIFKSVPFSFLDNTFPALSITINCIP